MNNKKKSVVGNIIAIIIGLIVLVAGGYLFYVSVYLPDSNKLDNLPVDDSYVKPGEATSIVDISGYEKEYNSNKFSMGEIERMAIDTNLNIQIGELTEKCNKLYGENKDFRALIVVPGCDVYDEPVMKTFDKYDYYLYRDFDKQHSMTGTLFFGEGVDEASDISIIHGHNMKNGDKFGALENYKNKSTYEKYPRFAVVTIKEVILYDIVGAVYTYIPEAGSTDFMYFNYLGTPDNNNKVEFIKWVNSNKLYNCREKLSADDKIMILSTCSYQRADGRFIIIAKRIN